MICESDVFSLSQSSKIFVYLLQEKLRISYAFYSKVVQVSLKTIRFVPFTVLLALSLSLQLKVLLGNTQQVLIRLTNFGFFLVSITAELDCYRLKIILKSIALRIRRLEVDAFR